MKSKKTIWTTITGGLSSAAPVLLSCCKGGACVGVCVSPVASLFGISSATIAASPIVNTLEPLLVAISAVSFTSSYYSLYVLPKFNSSSCDPNDCGCAPNEKEVRKNKIAKIVFWAGLVLSLGFLSYFEYEKYQAANTPSECASSDCTPASCSPDESSAKSCGDTCDSTTCE